MEVIKEIAPHVDGVVHRSRQGPVNELVEGRPGAGAKENIAPLLARFPMNQLDRDSMALAVVIDVERTKLALLFNDVFRPNGLAIEYESAVRIPQKERSEESGEILPSTWIEEPMM